MYAFPIGVIVDSFRLPLAQALAKAKSIGASGIQVYTTEGDMAPENLTPAKRRELLRLKRYYEQLDSIFDELTANAGCRKEYVWETDTMSGINWAQVPTTIVEMGYMSNPSEDRRMQQNSYQKKWYGELQMELRIT